MKKNLIKVLTLLFVVSFSHSQEDKPASVEKSIFGIQTGFLGIWVHNEYKLSNKIAFRTELGFDAGIFGGDFYPKKIGRAHV